METPFPGMDPYLEEPGMWPDVHHELIAIIRDQIQSQLASGYRAVITPYATFESIEIAPARARDAGLRRIAVRLAGAARPRAPRQGGPAPPCIPPRGAAPLRSPI